MRVTRENRKALLAASRQREQAWEMANRPARLAMFRAENESIREQLPNCEPTQRLFWELSRELRANRTAIAAILGR